MEQLKTVFPYSFLPKKGIGQLLFNVVTYLVAALAVSLLIGITAKIAVLGMIVGLLGGFAGLYLLFAIVLSVLDYLRII